MAKVKAQTSLALPLAGRTILITRARAQAGMLQEKIEDLGGKAVLFPTIEIQPPASYEALDEAIGSIGSYDWLIFTSVNGVDRFFERLATLNQTTAGLQKLELAAIGPETATRLRSAGLNCRLVPRRYQAEGLLDLLTTERIRGKRVLIPRAAKAREVLPDVLRERGAQVDVIEAYRTVIPTADVAAVIRSLKKREIDMVTFTSSSTVTNFNRLIEPERLADVLSAVAAACIGPITRQTLEDLGGRADVVAGEFTIPGLVSAIIDYFKARSG
jgi:uroporphyrinogen III methyltransferase/synthase